MCWVLESCVIGVFEILLLRCINVHSGNLSKKFAQQMIFYVLKKDQPIQLNLLNICSSIENILVQH
jgi:hypothetical protein